MAGFGKTLVRGLGAAMEGYGKHLTQVDERRQKTLELDALALRERALAEYRSGLAREEAAFSGGITRQNATHAGRIAAATYRENKGADVDAEVVLTPVKARATMAVNAANEGLQQSNREKQARLVSQLDMDEARQKAALDLENALTLAGKKADRWEVTADGAMVAYSATGAKLGQSQPGIFVPPSRGRSDSDEPDSLDDYRPGGGGKPAPVAPKRTAPTAADYSQFDQILAEAAMHPANRDRPAVQVRQEVIALARRQGIPAPPR